MNTLEAVCRMAESLRRRQDISMAALLKESGYSLNSAAVTPVSVESYLRAHPELVPVWSAYSEDQRGTPACYLVCRNARVGELEWVVGYMGGPGAAPTERLFPDEYSACAYFICRTVESLELGPGISVSS